MTAEKLFWSLAAELRAADSRIVESTIMNGRCLRVGKEFLALVDYKGSGLRRQTAEGAGCGADSGGHRRAVRSRRARV
jgi:hypothetical protein